MEKKYLLGLLSLTVTAALYADVKLPEIFSNHAVLQRSKATAIFGKADAGENITVTYGDIQGKTIANKDGKFIVKLDLSNVGKTANDLIVSGKNKIVIKDVIVGEVWLCTGQSNMAMRLATTLNARNEIKNSANNYIRMFLPKGTTSVKPIDEIKGQWLIALPQNAGRFTAVGYYFAKKLNKEADLSVGLINPSWGGSTIETWICKKHLNNSSSQVQKTSHEELDNYINYNAKRKDYLTKLLAWEKSVKWVDDTNSVAPPKDAKWQTAPAIDKGIAGPGIYWLQRTVDVNAKNRDGDTALHWAAYRGYVKVIKLLLADSRVKVNEPDNYGETALDIAMQKGYKDIINLLREAGARE
jgi:sialate O-acetylesterase